jgi:response regulator of citrate/malate metabolism
LHSFNRRMEIFGARRLSQESVDRARGCDPEPAKPGVIKGSRLRQVQAAIAAADGSVSAEDVAALTGMARVTARRYLEHLVTLGQCTVDPLPQGKGRPRKMYRPWLSGPVAATEDSGPGAAGRSG